MSETPVFRYDEKLYAPVSPEAPGGKAIEFHHFVDLASSVVWPKNDFGRLDPKQRPNFKVAKTLALGFLNGGREFGPVRDVRPLVLLALTEGGEGGPVAYAQAMDMVVANFMEFWDAMHPADDDGDGDFMTRMEELRNLFDPQFHLLALELSPLARSPQVGPLTLRSFMIAGGKTSPAAGEFAPDEAALDAILREEEDVRERVAQAHLAYAHVVERLRALDAFLEELTELSPRLDLSPLISGLEAQAALVRPFVGGEVAEEEEQLGDDADPDVEPGVAPKAATSTVANPRSGAEALALLHGIIAYYAAHSRSSPIPLALIALTDLMQADFNHWIAETVPKDDSGAALLLSGVDGSRLDSFAADGTPPPAPQIDLRSVQDTVGQLSKIVEGVRVALEEAIQSEECPEDIRKTVTMNVLGRFGKMGKLTAELTEKVTPDVPEAAVEESGEAGVRITDREGVKRALEVAATYWERAEPSNPAPGYLRRMKSLVDARFQDITRELIPEKSKEAYLRLEMR